MQNKELMLIVKSIHFNYLESLKRLNLNPKRIHQIVGSYMVLTVLGAGIVLWFHQERSDLLAIQEQQTYKMKQIKLL